jgi:hypothetical protein
MERQEPQRHEVRDAIEYFREFTRLIHTKRLWEGLHDNFLSLFAGKAETMLGNGERPLVVPFFGRNPC